MSDLTKILLKSDAPFVSTTVDPKHPVELFRHLTHKTGNTSSLSRPKNNSRCQCLATLVPLGKPVRALDPSTLRNGDSSFCTLHVRQILHWVQEEDLAPSAPQALHHPPHHLALDRVLLLLLLDLLDLDFPALKAPTWPGTPLRRLRQWHRVNIVSFRFHVGVVHVVLFVRNCATVVL